MDIKNILSNISSKYIFILEAIFDYTGVNFKMKLFFYSKYYQQKLGLELFYYQQLYLKQNNVNLVD